MIAHLPKPDLVEALEGELVDVQARRSRLMAGFEAGVLSLDDVGDRLDVLAARRERIERRIKDVEAGPVVFSTTRTWTPT